MYWFQIKLFHHSKWIRRCMFLYSSKHWSKPTSWRDPGFHPFLQINCICIAQLLFHVKFISIPQHIGNQKSPFLVSITQRSLPLLLLSFSLMQLTQFYESWNNARSMGKTQILSIGIYFGGTGMHWKEDREKHYIWDLSHLE